MIRVAATFTVSLSNEFSKYRSCDYFIQSSFINVEAELRVAFLREILCDVSLVDEEAAVVAVI